MTDIFLTYNVSKNRERNKLELNEETKKGKIISKFHAKTQNQESDRLEKAELKKSKRKVIIN